MDRSLRHRTDAELLAVAETNREAFAELYRRHEALVVGYLARRSRDPELAADLAAETFVVALAKASRYRDEHGSAAGWLLGIAQNCCWRRCAAGAPKTVRAAGWGVAPLALDDEALERVDALADAGPGSALLAALETLPAEQRDAIRAHVLNDAPYDELAQRLGTQPATVRQRVHRGLARMRTTLEGNGP